MQKKKWLLLGGSRGIGLAFYQLLSVSELNTGLIVSRKAPKCSLQPFWSWKNYDFSHFEQTPLPFLLSDFDYLVYFAAGGPFGFYQNKQWKDHLWSFKVSLLFPSYLINLGLKEESLKMVFIGSKIAEAQPDPMAASYAASKHGLKGLISSILSESKSNREKLMLFSPGYVDTDLLPPNALPRKQSPDVIESKVSVAENLYLKINHYF